MISTKPLRIDFVSDIACPWCAIGLASLQQALQKLSGTVEAEIHLQPFELEPDMPFEGKDAGEHLKKKYGIGDTQLEANRKALRERAAPLGININHGPGKRVYNTFDAHRMLHWAEQQDHERPLTLQQALFRAYFTDNENVADHDVLVRLAGEVGLDADAARRMLSNNEHADAVRAQERHYLQAGIHSVPATIVNNSQLIPGGQPPEVFENALRQIVDEAPVA